MSLVGLFCDIYKMDKTLHTSPTPVVVYIHVKRFTRVKHFDTSPNGHIGKCVRTGTLVNMYGQRWAFGRLHVIRYPLDRTRIVGIWRESNRHIEPTLEVATGSYLWVFRVYPR